MVASMLPMTSVKRYTVSMACFETDLYPAFRPWFPPAAELVHQLCSYETFRKQVHAYIPRAETSCFQTRQKTKESREFCTGRSVCHSLCVPPAALYVGDKRTRNINKQDRPCRNLHAFAQPLPQVFPSPDIPVIPLASFPSQP